MNKFTHLGADIRETRKSLGLTLKDLSKVLGIPYAHLSAVERCKVGFPKYNHILEKLCKTFKWDISEAKEKRKFSVPLYWKSKLFRLFSNTSPECVEFILLFEKLEDSERNVLISSFVKTVKEIKNDV